MKTAWLSEGGIAALTVVLFMGSCGGKFETGQADDGVTPSTGGDRAAGASNSSGAGSGSTGGPASGGSTGGTGYFGEGGGDDPNRGGAGSEGGAGGDDGAGGAVRCEPNEALDWGEAGTPSEVLVYEHVNPDLAGVWIARLDGTNAQRLIENARMPALSPDGTRLAFLCDYALWISNSDGSDARELIDDDVTWVVWSPDGQSLLIGNGGLGRVDTNGEGLTDLLPLGVYADYAEWQGSTIVYERHGAIWRKNAGDANPGVSLTDLNGLHGSFSVALSPDGSRIAFVRNNAELFVMNSDGSSPERLTPEDYPMSEYGLGSPTWSRDGKKLLFTLFRLPPPWEATGTLVLMDVVEQNPVNLLEGGTQGRFGAFSP
jgi:hypothetical protein